MTEFRFLCTQLRDQKEISLKQKNLNFFLQLKGRKKTCNKSISIYRVYFVNLLSMVLLLQAINHLMDDKMFK